MSILETSMTTGKIAIVDEAYLPLLEGRSWDAFVVKGKCYAHAIDPGRCGILMHRLLMNAPDGIQVDHKDGNGLNNTRTNLRLATGQQNLRNMRKHRGKSQYKGVTFVPKCTKRPWTAQISPGDSRCKHLGSFATELEAAKAYDRAAKELFGEFACTNFMEVV